MIGDAEGVVVLPAHLANDLAAEAFEMTAYEDFAFEQVRQGSAIFELYPATDASREKFASWRKERGR